MVVYGVSLAALSLSRFKKYICPIQSFENGRKVRKAPSQDQCGREASESSNTSSSNFSEPIPNKSPNLESNLTVRPKESTKRHCRESAELAKKKIKQERFKEHKTESNATSSDSPESREGSCEKNECINQKSCCLSLLPGCVCRQDESSPGPKIGTKPFFFHISKGEHVCQICYEEVTKAGRPTNDLYFEWKNRWLAESRCAPFVRLFMLEQLLPFGSTARIVASSAK
uniref:Uncharacterized protein n=1 Tax=Ditylenchus dipsaci TaxID=166011 RepID=A0A915E9W2_9BILA